MKGLLQMSCYPAFLCYPNTDLLSEQNDFAIPTGTCYFTAVQDK